MHVTHLSLADFRSYPSAELPLEPGVTALVGPNGQGKTNLVEAIGYVASLSSHRVAQARIAPGSPDLQACCRSLASFLYWFGLGRGGRGRASDIRISFHCVA